MELQYNFMGPVITIQLSDIVTAANFIGRTFRPFRRKLGGGKVRPLVICKSFLAQEEQLSVSEKVRYIFIITLALIGHFGRIRTKNNSFSRSTTFAADLSGRSTILIRPCRVMRPRFRSVGNIYCKVSSDHVSWHRIISNCSCNISKLKKKTIFSN